MVALFREGAWKIPALGLGIVGLGLLMSPRPAAAPAAASGSASPPASVTTVGGSLEIKGLHAELIDGESQADGEGYNWWTTWRLCWDRVPGASEYLVTAVSFEGAGRPQSTAANCHELGVANGNSAQAGTHPGRDAQLTQMEISMSVNVAARMPDGTIGPASADIPVGEEYP